MKLRKPLLFLVLVFVLIPGIFALVHPKSTSITHADPPLPTVTTGELFTDVNAERVKAGLPPLVEDVRLDESATAKCSDMTSKQYWAHVAPDGTEPWQFITDAGVIYSTAGENLARGFQSSQAVVDGWMASPEHKDNILDTRFVDVGYAICGNIVVEHFTS